MFHFQNPSIISIIYLAYIYTYSSKIPAICRENNLVYSITMPWHRLFLFTN
ncbi:hypothetical protein CLOBOL_01492 [Enterocloster bolteae ATCC BAA-613]|uniref:Uncharacterized protein n=1 Tax=Enterocloster bolteae (strain ATCC BAA-613 / DSM 15670 / CCUG 46953 / JCM 12243 / WAL 16351) TaxID=411902 RepID=A8RL30_ENTBW|nr:hypothetical protein CLOBOL_01492 [Enterocloster bolteae ATCC BAA-613]